MNAHDTLPAHAAKTFVERHGLWTDDQTRAANAVAQAIKRHKIELVRFSFADQHGVLRGKTVMAEDAPALMRSGVTMTTTLLAKDTAHKTAWPVFTRGGGFDMEEMQGAGDFVMVADPATFRVLPWAENTGWLLCDIYFTNGKPVPFSTRQVLRDALARLRRRRLRFPRRPRGRVSSVQAGESAAGAGGRHLAAASARGEPAQPGLSVSHREPVRSARCRLAADPPRHGGARPAAALARNRAGAEPVRVHLPAAGRPRRRRYDDSVSRRHQTDRAAQRPAGELHVPAGAAQSVFLGLASAHVADRPQAQDQCVHGRRARRPLRPRR